MLWWVISENEQAPLAEGPERVVRFAVAQSSDAVRLGVELQSPMFLDAPPDVLARSTPVDCQIEPIGGSGTQFRYVLVVDPPANPTQDDQVIIDLAGPEDSAVPPCRVVLRRSTCRIASALLGEEGEQGGGLDPETIAALRWHGWGRYAAVVGLKRFLTGRGGGKVLVVRPRLRAPDASASTLESSGPPEVLADAWGSALLVKTGKTEHVRKEWDRGRAFLADRLHPFLARSEAYLAIRTPMTGETPSEPPARAALICSFLGGDLLHPEPLDELLRGVTDLARCRKLLDQVFAILAPWQAPAEAHPLGRWRRVYRGNENDWLLFGKFDLTRETTTGKPYGRDAFSAGLRWDTSFIKGKHLADHLMGKNRDGLLYRLREIEVRYALTHGDLNPRNILCDGDDVWLIDFAQAGVAPVLADYARLEANLRLWCLPLRPAGDNVEDAARAFECRLLDHFLGSEGGLAPTVEQAARLGAEPGDLLRIAHAIAHIRRRAAAHCLSVYPDRRDYLAVLYLTVLSVLQYAGGRNDPPENHRVLVSLAWVLEEALNRLLGRTPFDRKRTTLNPINLLSAGWLLSPGAPRRVVYFLDRDDGRRALEPLAATRGVLQSQRHHLDVFEHTLLVLAYVEALLGDPLAGFLDPAALDVKVADSLAEQGIALLPIPAPSAHPAPTDVSGLKDFLEPIKECLANALKDEPSRLVLKWAALLHDVGKPGTRCLNTEAKPYKVQFLGHELYGLELLARHLEHLFPDERVRRRLEWLIEHHHRHHQLGDGYKHEPTEALDAAPGHSPAKPSQRLRSLLDGLNRMDVTNAEFKRLCKFFEETPESLAEFPLLILFGFADTLACRGPESLTSVADVARVDLALLAAWISAPWLRARERENQKEQDDHHELFHNLCHQLRVESGRSAEDWKPIWQAAMSELRPWFRREQAAGHMPVQAGRIPPELEQKARELLKQGPRLSSKRKATRAAESDPTSP
jgi:putative nucleotidyltransferase with HDIG domain